MSDTIEKLDLQNRYLASEVRRLQNNIDYLDQKLDEELEKSAMLYAEVRRLQAKVAEVAKR
jgi:peptidoglycan hydrolase CwlO-like protein